MQNEQWQPVTNEVFEDKSGTVTTQRLRVQSGWLYRTYTWPGLAIDMVFVPDYSVGVQ